MAKPEKTYKARGCQASVFMNEVTVNGEKKKIPSIDLHVNYKDKEGKWKSTHKLGVTDIPNAIAVLRKAYEELVIKTESPNANGAVAGEFQPAG